MLRLCRIVGPVETGEGAHRTVLREVERRQVRLAVAGDVVPVEVESGRRNHAGVDQHDNGRPRAAQCARGGRGAADAPGWITTAGARSHEHRRR